MQMSEDKDDVHMGPVEETSRQPQDAISARGNFSEAMEYVKLVGDTFRDDRQKYKEFLRILNNYRLGTTTIQSTKAEVEELFKGHPDLIIGFNRFLPISMAGEVALASEEQPAVRPFPIHEAINFVNKVELRFVNEDERFESFLEVLSVFLKDRKPREEVYREMAAVLEGHVDLLEEFRQLCNLTYASYQP